MDPLQTRRRDIRVTAATFTPAEALAPESMSTPSSMPRRLALVIEDSDDTRELYAVALEFDGYIVAQARDGQDGLQQARALVPDVIVTDLAMPIMDGWEMSRRLRADPRTRNIPVIACSAHDARRRTDASAPDVLLRKPFAFDLLLVEMRRLLQQRAA